MMHSWKRLLDLARRTGDRLIVTDPEGDGAFVVMSVDQYESLLDAQHDFEGSDQLEGFGDRPWEASFDDPEEYDPGNLSETAGPTGLPSEESQGFDDADFWKKETDKKIWDAMVEANDPSPTWNLEHLDAGEREEVKGRFEQWKEAKKDVSPVGGEDEGEERFYLEPIE
jgi:hypothetical protein